MLIYSMPTKIIGYSGTAENLQFVPNKKIDTSVLAKSKTTDFSNLQGLVKTAKLVHIAPKEEDFLYVRVRAVSAGNVIENHDGSATVVALEDLKKNPTLLKKIRGANSNGDFFSEDELKRTYKTFVGKSAFVDHDNENVEKARGIILDAHWNNRGKFVELLVAVDKVAYPELARGVELGYITDVSMGCRCGYSLCSVCANKAVTEQDFCDHVRKFKASTYNGLPVFEDNRDIEFFEISFVTTGADKDAKILERVAGKMTRGIQKISSVSERELALTKIASETNKRLSSLVSDKFRNDLNGLPWSK